MVSGGSGLQPFGKIPSAGTPEGDRIRDGFISALLAITGDVNFLLLPNLSDTTTTAEDSRHGATVTWSESLATFDAERLRRGSGVAIQFNGSDEEGDTPDAAQHTFGDGVSDSPFSVIALVNPDTVSGMDTIIAKFDETSASELREWRIELNVGDPRIQLADESANAVIGRSLSAGIATGTWALLVFTYDGGGASSDINIFLNGTEGDDTDENSGSYTAMEDTATLMTVAAHLGTAAAADFFDGSIALIAVVAAALDADQIHSIKALANSYFNLSL